MRNRLISILAVMAILLTVFPFGVEAAAEVTLNPIPAKTPGGSVTIGGQTSLDEVSIKVIRPNHTVLYVDVVEPGDGSYSKTFNLPADAAAGTYTVVVGQGIKVTSGTFVVSSHSGGGGDQVNLNPISNKLPGDSVTISGETNLDEVSIKVIRPNNTILFVEVAEVSNGTYTKTFQLATDAATGTYTVVAGQGDIVATETFVVKEALSSSANLSNLTLSKGELDPAFSPGKTEYTVIVGNKVESITVTPITEDACARVKINEVEVASGQASDALSLKVGSNKITVLVTAEIGTTKEYKLEIKRRHALNSSQEDIELDENTKDLELSENVDRAEITIPDDVKDASINVNTQETSTGGKMATLPELRVSATRKIGNAVSQIKMEAPRGTVVKGPSNWDGTIRLPEVLGNDQVSGVEGDVSAVVEVGFGDYELVFDNAVRLLLPGQAGKAAGYVRGGKFTPINYSLGSDSQEAADRELTGARKDGKIDAGSDLAIWTKHFTKFVSYTPEEEPTPPPSGGGGGGAPAGDLISTSGGTVTKYGATVSIPRDAFDSSIRVKIKKIADVSELSLAANCKIASNVVEITKDKTGNFNKPVTITMTFDSSEVDTEKHNLSICWLNEETETWAELDNVKVDLVAGEVTGETNHFTKFAVIATEKVAEKVPESPTVALTDITGHWAESAITEMVKRGVVGGYPDNTFKPNSDITRAEFAVFLVRALNLEPRQGKVFADTAGHWAEKDIAAAEFHGIVGGYDVDHFGPNDLITREQMASMVVRAKNLPAVTERLTFADTADISDWAKGAVATAVKYDIVNGYLDNTVRPKKNATRAEAITVIFNATN